jgi:hypothetical protein
MKMSADIGSEYDSLEPTRNRLHEWLFPVQQFEFTVPQSIDVCVKRLLATEQSGFGGWLMGNTFKTDIVRTPDNTYVFTVSYPRGAINLPASGELIDNGDNTTIVTGEVTVRRRGFIVYFLIMIGFMAFGLFPVSELRIAVYALCGTGLLFTSIAAIVLGRQSIVAQQKRLVWEITGRLTSKYS